MTNQVDHQGLVLSVDAKPRLKWTRQLHERFVDAVTQLGGSDKATPKSVMRVMGVPGLTLYHLKSHLQKYRLSKNRDVSTANDDKKQNELWTRDETSQPQCAESMLQQIQIDVQRKLQEQIEVQKHLQLRIEAQGKYLQSVLRKAQETLDGNQNADTSMDSCLTLEKSELKEKDASTFSFSAGDRDETKPLNSKSVKIRGETEEFDLNA